MACSWVLDEGSAARCRVHAVRDHHACMHPCVTDNTPLEGQETLDTHAHALIHTSMTCAVGLARAAQGQVPWGEHRACCRSSSATVACTSSGACRGSRACSRSPGGLWRVAPFPPGLPTPKKPIWWVQLGVCRPFWSWTLRMLKPCQEQPELALGFDASVAGCCWHSSATCS